MFGTSHKCKLYFLGVVAYVVSLLTVVYTSTVTLPPKHTFAAPGFHQLTYTQSHILKFLGPSMTRILRFCKGVFLNE
jgi:hypothetical protein